MPMLVIALREWLGDGGEEDGGDGEAAGAPLEGFLLPAAAPSILRGLSFVGKSTSKTITSIIYLGKQPLSSC